MAGRHRVSVDPLGPQDEVVYFELPSRAVAERMLVYLSRTWIAGVQPGSGGFVVRVLLQPSRGDLARLLRTVQGWLEDAAVGDIRFRIDDNNYVLEAKRSAGR